MMTESEWGGGGCEHFENHAHMQSFDSNIVQRLYEREPEGVGTLSWWRCRSERRYQLKTPNESRPAPVG